MTWQRWGEVAEEERGQRDGITENSRKQSQKWKEIEEMGNAGFGGNEDKMGIFGNYYIIVFWRQRPYGIGRYGYLNTCAFIKMKENEIKSKLPKGKASHDSCALPFSICCYISLLLILYISFLNSIIF